MPKSFKAARYETHGNPADVLRMEKRLSPNPRPDKTSKRPCRQLLKTNEAVKAKVEKRLFSSGGRADSPRRRPHYSTQKEESQETTSLETGRSEQWPTGTGIGLQRQLRTLRRSYAGQPGGGVLPDQSSRARESGACAARSHPFVVACSARQGMKASGV